ncbi:DUF2871 domain-containing protein [Treponema putidum]|uniref:DUF2871 domain-containing protein n=1 Tax=Treponema putidum TaxID=221027 RepID=UPI003D92CB7C
MYIVESVFDLSYLALVIALSIKLLLQKDRTAKLFGLMALLLGAGDSFHLLPRVISMWHKGGFEANAFYLSIGVLITSITMTVFYLLFYRYYKIKTNTSSKTKDIIIYSLALIRLVLTVLPQNEWGMADASYTWSIIRNIPFAALGAVLIYFFYQARKTPGLEHMALLTALSFLFYLPVVLFSKTVPVVGSLMMPKTVAYVGIVYVGFKHFIPKFSLKNILENSFVYLILGLIAGVFFREFTKFNAFSGSSYLSLIHPHVLILGSVLSLVIYLTFRQGSALIEKRLACVRKANHFWNSGLLITVVLMLLRGIITVLGNNYTSKDQEAALSGIAGIGHILLTLGLIYTFLMILKTRED